MTACAVVENSSRSLLRQGFHSSLAMTAVCAQFLTISLYFLDVYLADWILVTESSPSQPLQLYACHVAASQRGQPESWSWSRVGLPDAQSYPPVVAAAVSQVEADILQLSPTVGPADVTFEAVLLRRRDRPGPQPAIITPHGGPHTAYSAQFFMPLSFLVASGYNVILVNYRGSTGFGEASIQVGCICIFGRKCALFLSFPVVLPKGCDHKGSRQV